MTDAIDVLPRLVSVAEAAKYLGLKEPQVRALVAAKKMAKTLIGSRYLIPREALDAFILENTVQPCRDEIQAPASASSKSADAFTSSGQRVDAAASAQRALRTADLLKPRSPTSCTSARATPARVIPLRSS